MIENINFLAKSLVSDIGDVRSMVDKCETALLENRQPHFCSENRCYILSKNGNNVEFIITMDSDLFFIEEVSTKSIVKTCSNLSYMFAYGDGRFVKPTAFADKFDKAERVFSGENLYAYINDVDYSFGWDSPAIRFRCDDKEFFSFDFDGNLLFYYDKDKSILYDVKNNIKIENASKNWEGKECPLDNFNIEYKECYIKEFKRLADVMNNRKEN